MIAWHILQIHIRLMWHHSNITSIIKSNTIFPLQSNISNFDKYNVWKIGLFRLYGMFMCIYNTSNKNNIKRLDVLNQKIGGKYIV